MTFPAISLNTLVAFILAIRVRLSPQNIEGTSSILLLKRGEYPPPCKPNPSDSPSLRCRSHPHHAECRHGQEKREHAESER